MCVLLNILKQHLAKLIVVMMLLVGVACQQSDNSSSGASGQALLDAVMLGDDRRAALLLTEGVYTEVRNQKGDTPVLHAVKTGNMPIVRMMLRHDVDTDARTSSGKGLLELALDSGNEKMAHLLIENGVSPDEVAHDGNPLLLKAVRLHDLPTVKLLLRSGVNPNAAGKDGLTPLHLAAREADIPMLQRFIKSGADLEATDDLGNTPLAYVLSSSSSAAEQGNSRQSIAKLLGLGANPVVLAAGKIPLIHLAVSRGMLAETLTLLNHGALINSPGPGGTTALDIAWQNKDWNTIDLLLSRGADPQAMIVSALETENLTALHLLRRRGHDIASAARSQRSQSDHIIASCVRSKKTALLDFLLECGVEVNTPGLEGERPLHMAIAMRDTGLVKVLLARGANPNLQFHRPASKSFLALAQKKSMQWFLKNDRRLTPLMMAANNGDLGIIAALIDHGAKKYTYSGRHRLYPLNFASRRSDVKSMQVILGQDPNNEKYHGVLDLSEQRVRIYNSKDEVIFSSRVSTGKRGFRTPTGTFVVTDKHRSHNSSIYGSSMPYFQRLSCSAFGFHSGNCPGYPASHGCIRMPYSSAKKLFSITPVGTRVVIQR